MKHTYSDTVLAKPLAMITTTIMAATLAAPGSVAQTRLAGTLRCTLGSGEIAKLREPRELSCLFRPVDGVETGYVGQLKKLLDPSQTADTLVFVWQVLAEELPLPVGALEGRFAGIINVQDDDGKPAGSLTGGINSSLQLRPLTRLPDTGRNYAPLVLELDLKSIKA